MVLLICIKRYNKEDFFLLLENLRNQGEFLKNLRNDFVRLRNLSSEKTGNLRNKSSTGKNPSFLMFRYWVYIVKAIQRIETISLPSTYENLFLQIKQLLLVPKLEQSAANMSKSWKHKILWCKKMWKFLQSPCENSKIQFPMNIYI